MANLSREVLKWLQSLDLSCRTAYPKWDFSNGLLFAEIFSWYFPRDINIRSFNTGQSLEMKQRNWYLLKCFIKKHSLPISEHLINGTIYCKENAAVMLINQIYELLTASTSALAGETTAKSDASGDGPAGFTGFTDFTDCTYQHSLPLHARSTATKAIKVNISLQENLAEISKVLGQQKAQNIINMHIDHRRDERDVFPERFQVQKTLTEKCVRRAPPVKDNQSMEISVPTVSVEALKNLASQQSETDEGLRLADKEEINQKTNQLSTTEIPDFFVNQPSPGGRQKVAEVF